MDFAIKFGRSEFSRIESERVEDAVFVVLRQNSRNNVFGGICFEDRTS